MRAWLIGSAAALLWCGAASLASAALPPAVAEAEKHRIEVVAAASKAVVAVFGQDGKGGGSGVLISPDGYALSNYHVVNPCGAAMKCGLSDGRLYDAVVVGIDMTGDVALIKLLGRDDFPVAPLANSDDVRVGDWCFAMGNPFLLAVDFTPTITYGVVSGVSRYQYPAGTLLEYTDCIQTDASINPGNSGGPLFDAEGRLIGINGRGSFEKRGRVNVGVGYAISINQIKNFMGGLRAGRYVDHATLGAQVNTSEDGRVTVSNVLEGSDVYRRGMRFKDELLSFGGRSISTVNGFKNVLGVFPSDWRVPVSFRHEGKRVDALVRLRGAHREGELAMMDQGKPQQGKGPPRPGPQAQQAPAPAKMPDAVAKVYEKKPGFANYYFNRLNQDRVWQAFNARRDFSNFQGTWTLTGEDERGGAMQFKVNDKAVAIALPGGEVAMAVGDDLSQDAQPIGSGGLSAALYLWRKLLVEGPKGFSEISYLGSAPLPGRHDLADCLTAVHGKVEVRFFFDPATGELVGLEMFGDDNDDPCEITFSEPSDVQGRPFPHRIEVRYGDSVFGVWKLTNITLATAAEVKP